MVRNNILIVIIKELDKISLRLVGNILIKATKKSVFTFTPFTLGRE